MFGSGKKTFIDADSSCKDRGGFLVEPRTEAINNVAKTYPFSPALWIGLSYIAENFNYIWQTDRTTLTYTDWGPGKPTGADCVTIGKNMDAWSDIACSHKRHYLCEARKRKSYYVIMLFCQFPYWTRDVRFETKVGQI